MWQGRMVSGVLIVEQALTVIQQTSTRDEYLEFLAKHQKIKEENEAENAPHSSSQPCSPVAGSSLAAALDKIIPAVVSMHLQSH